MRDLLKPLVAAVVIMSLSPVAARAVTKAELEQARRELGSLQKRLDAAVQSYERAESQLARTQAEMVAAQLRLGEAERELQSAQRTISARANLAYRAGPYGLIQALLFSEGLTDFSRRLMFLERAAGSDSTILLRASRVRGEIAELKETLSEKRADELRERNRLSGLADELNAQFERAKALEARLAADLEERLRREREAARRAALAAAAARRSSSSFNPGSFVCPVDGPRSFRDSWGEPRSGGRRHQGVDIYAPKGTPAAAVVSGVILRMSSSRLGGISLYLRGDDGTEYYYAHLAGYGEASPGRRVAAGTHIAYVGNSGNASGGASHLHFEIHPGGGAAINPYPTVKAACG